MKKIKPNQITKMAKALFSEERSINRLDGWLYAREIKDKYEADCSSMNVVEKAGYLLKKVAEELPLFLSDNAIFAGTQRDAFARSYALINPSFKVESFAGYCNPTDVFGDIEPNNEITKERIDVAKMRFKDTDYCRAVFDAYEKCETYTSEVAFFVEQVTGHVIPDVRPLLKNGTTVIRNEVLDKMKNANEKQTSTYKAMLYSLDALEIFAKRYKEIAEEKLNESSCVNEEALNNIISTLSFVPQNGARNLFDAIQFFILIWQTMCIEQSPNPFAFSVGNADRIFEPFRAIENTSREETSALFKHLLVFFNVADRSWAISQNLIVGGRDVDGKDLTSVSSYALLDAYFDMNLPQPILSVKLHKNTPVEFYESLGRFLFTPGVLTPSFFNDDAVFEVLKLANVDEADLPDYSVAGCQEPLIMGKDNGNTTNSWLNLGKILELTLLDGVSSITKERILPQSRAMDFADRLRNIRTLFYENLEFLVDKMTNSANDVSRALSNLPVPFLSLMMGGIETGYDMRDVKNQGTKYNGSGCLIHGNSVVADSFVAIDRLLSERPQDVNLLKEALENNFENQQELKKWLMSCPKFGNNDIIADEETRILTQRVADIVSKAKNYLGNPFRPDFSTPSTHLLYGYWVGALPNGRGAREMHNYGIDPLAGDAHDGMGFRALSTFKLPFEKMCGGYASHFGIDPKYFTSTDLCQKGVEFYNKIIKPLFFNEANASRVSPFYLYVNVTTPDILRKVLKNPKKYAPSGVYIMRIHGTFVNFLDLSPAIQQDIIKRLDLNSTTGEC